MEEKRIQLKTLPHRTFFLPKKIHVWAHGFFLCSLCLFILAYFPSSIPAAVRPQEKQDVAPKPSQTAVDAFNNLCNEFHQRCQELAKSDNEDIRSQASQCLKHLYVNQISDNVLLLPASQSQLKTVRRKLSDAKAAGTKPKTQKEWNVRKLRTDFSAKLLSLAQQVAVQGTENLSRTTEPVSGYQWNYQLARKLVWLSLFWDQDNKKARVFLGHRLKKGIWGGGRFQTPIAKKAIKADKQLRWQRRTYWRIDSGNFLILTRSEQQNAINLAKQLEKWRVLWRQSMMPFWVQEHVFRSRLRDLRPLPTSSERKHTVILFRNRQEFLQQLAHIDGIEISVGYYDPKLRRSFFYLNSDQNDDLVSTWKHETVHQLFQETGRHTTKPAEKNNLWLMEGIAMYFESLHQVQQNPDTSSVWAIGGPYANRLQYARLRVFREGYFIPLRDFFSRGRIAFQKSQSIARDYSQSAGLAQFFFEYQNGKYRQAMFQMIGHLYNNRCRSDMVETITEQDSKTLASEYRQWLSSKLDPNLRNSHPFVMSHREMICLPNAELEGKSLSQISLNKNLTFLCLSSNRLESLPDAWWPFLKNLEDLYLDANPIRDKTLKEITNRCPELRQLDLASTLVTDAGIKELSKAQKLQYLWLAGTSTGDQSVEFLIKMPNLVYLDIRKTNISGAGATILKQHIKKVID